MDWLQLAASTPDAASFTALTAVRPAQLPPAELVDAIVTAEKLISYLHALQIGAVAEFARPGRSGDLTGLIDLLTEKGGQAKLPDGTINIDALETLIQEEAQPDHPHEHALPGQDQHPHDQRHRDGTCSSHYPADRGDNFGAGPADREHAAACAAPTAEPNPPPTITDITAQYVRRHIQQQDHNTTRDRIQQIIQRHWDRHHPSDPATAPPAPRLFGKHVITPIGTIETTLQQLVTAAAQARQRPTDIEQPPF